MGWENLQQFSDTLSKWAREQPAAIVKQAQAKLAIDIFTSAAISTPVDTGRARGGWQIGISNPPEGDPGRHVKGAGLGALATELAKVATLGDFGIVYIANNVEYILVLEDGLFNPPNPGPSSDPRDDRTGRVLVAEGFSVQAPQGMLGVAIASALTAFDIVES